MMILVKLVAISKTEGKRVRTVIRPNSCNVTEYSVPPVALWVALKIGKTLCAATELDVKRKVERRRNLIIPSSLVKPNRGNDILIKSH